jgi:hypothetical protein
LFLSAGQICTVLLDPSKKYEAGTLADVVKIIVKLIDEPELGHVVDAGEFFDSFSFLSFDRFLTY